MSKVEVIDHERCRVVTVNRPERRNAIDRETADALFEIFDNFDDASDVDIAILTGSDGTFCSGADLVELASADLSIDLERGPLGPTRMRLSKPVIAAIEGYAVAGGLELALWCDLRIAGESAILGVFNRRFGVPLVDMGTIRLPRIVGQGRALDMILTGRAVSAGEALDMGLVNRVVPDGEALRTALTLAMAIAANPQITLRSDRQSLLDQWGMAESDAIENEHNLGLASIGEGEAVEGARRFRGGAGRHGRGTD